MHWIITYDISNKKRLQQAHRYLSKHAIALQNSTFLYSGSLKTFEHHFQQLTHLLNPKEDDLRAYPLTTTLYNLGKSSLAQGIYLANFPEQPLAPKATKQ